MSGRDWSSTPGHGVTRRGLFRRGVDRALSEGEELVEVAVREGAELRDLVSEDPAGPSSEERAANDHRRAALRALEGEGGALSELLPRVARELVTRSGAAAGESVLVAAGDGSAEATLAERGARVTACDRSAWLVERGRARCRTEGFETEWLEADLERLPFADRSFDRVVSCFGPTFEPRPAAVLGELLRVARPGGVVAIATWASTGVVGEALELAHRYAPVPAGAERPSRWGRYETLYRHLTGLSSSFDSVSGDVRLDFDSVAELWRALANPPGPLAPAVAQAPDSAVELEERIAALARAHGAVEPGGAVALEGAYLLTTAIAARRAATAGVPTR